MPDDFDAINFVYARVREWATQYSDKSIENLNPDNIDDIIENDRQALELIGTLTTWKRSYDVAIKGTNGTFINNIIKNVTGPETFQEHYLTFIAVCPGYPAHGHDFRKELGHLILPERESPIYRESILYYRNAKQGNYLADDNTFTCCDREARINPLGSLDRFYEKKFIKNNVEQKLIELVAEETDERSDNVATYMDKLFSFNGYRKDQPIFHGIMHMINENLNTADLSFPSPDKKASFAKHAAIDKYRTAVNNALLQIRKQMLPSHSVDMLSRIKIDVADKLIEKAVCGEHLGDVMGQTFITNETRETGNDSVLYSLLMSTLDYCGWEPKIGRMIASGHDFSVTAEDIPASRWVIDSSKIEELLITQNRQGNKPIIIEIDNMIEGIDFNNSAGTSRKRTESGTYQSIHVDYLIPAYPFFRGELKLTFKDDYIRQQIESGQEHDAYKKRKQTEVSKMAASHEFNEISLALFRALIGKVFSYGS